jgi:VWFA-related protein
MPHVPKYKLLLTLLLFSFPTFAPAQTTAPPAKEISSEDTTSSFKLNVNLVVVRVVVRDANGKPIPNLNKDDFLLFDNGKPQLISSFSVETPVSHISTQKTDSAAPEPAAAASSTAPVQTPQRFVALYFDDLNVSDSDLSLARQAAIKLLSAMTPSDRLAVFTSSGRFTQDFTSDPDKLSSALQQLAPHPLGGPSTSGDCPPMTYYEGYQIIEIHDVTATQVANADVMNCMPVGVGDGAQRQNMIYAAAQHAYTIGQSQAHLALRNLQAVIRRMSVLPGQRVIAMMSPGFLATPTIDELSDVIDYATKGNVVINTIDARGLYTSKRYDATASPNGDVGTPRRAELIQTEESVMGDVLSSIADGTGGTYFHNRNDIDQGLLQAAAEPEVSYVLGFSPQNLKYDGKYHHLKVTLSSKRSNLSLQARRGYFAPKKSSDPQQLAGQEIDDAITSQEELRELPVNCETQIFKGEKGTRLTVVARVDTKNLKFRKVDDRNNDHLQVVMALFDENGNFLSAVQRTVNLQLKDATLALLNKSGIRVKLDFDVPPGNLLVRVVVRDSEGSQLGATSQPVSIPN